MVEIRLDGEKLLSIIKHIEAELNVIRRMGAMGTSSPFNVTGIDLTKIEWKGKGSEPASAGAKWAWAFGYDEDDNYKPESKDLVQAIEQTGKVEIDGYVMILSGRDKRLISRKKLK